VIAVDPNRGAAATAGAAPAAGSDVTPIVARLEDVPLPIGLSVIEAAMPLRRPGARSGGIFALTSAEADRQRHILQARDKSA